MIVLGPVIFGLLLGLIIGSQIKLALGNTNFTLLSFIIIVLAGIVVAWQLGQYPFYNDSPFATGFLSALIGLIIGKLIFARGK